VRQVLDVEQSRWSRWRAKEYYLHMKRTEEEDLSLLFLLQAYQLDAPIKLQDFMNLLDLNDDFAFKVMERFANHGYVLRVGEEEEQQIIARARRMDGSIQAEKRSTGTWKDWEHLTDEEPYQWLMEEQENEEVPLLEAVPEAAPVQQPVEQPLLARLWNCLCPNMCRKTEVAAFLERTGLGRYTAKFVARGYDDIEDLREIQEAELAAMGILPGHIMKLKRCLAQMED